MSELKPCPICGATLKIYSPEDWKPTFYDPDSGGDPCNAVCDCGFQFSNGSYNYAEFVAALNRRAQPDNEPLTIDELRGMDGEPVYIVAHPDWGHWELSEDAEDYFDCRDEDFYGMTMPPSLPDPMGRYGLHVLGWLAYRRKPGGSENDA